MLPAVPLCLPHLLRLWASPRCENLPTKCSVAWAGGNQVLQARSSSKFTVIISADTYFSVPHWNQSSKYSWVNQPCNSASYLLSWQCLLLLPPESSKLLVFCLSAGLACYLCARDMPPVVSVTAAARGRAVLTWFTGVYLQGHDLLPAGCKAQSLLFELFWALGELLEAVGTVSRGRYNHSDFNKVLPSEELSTSEHQGPAPATLVLQSNHLRVVFHQLQWRICWAYCVYLLFPVYSRKKSWFFFFFKSSKKLH